MNSLDAEYSFLAPAWTLPTVATKSMYADTYSSPEPSPDRSTWNNTLYNARYIPPILPYPKAVYSPRDRPLFSSTKDRYEGNPVGTVRHSRRVQIIEPTPRPERQNHFNVHEHLYELSTPNPGSYANAYRNQQRRLQHEPIDQRSVLNDYKTFLNNGGFGPAFGNSDSQTFEQKLDAERKRKAYAEAVRESNQSKIDEFRRGQHRGAFDRYRAFAGSLTRNRPTQSNVVPFSSPKETWSRAHAIDHLQPMPSSELYSHAWLTPVPLPDSLTLPSSTLHPWNQVDLLAGELYLHPSTPPVRRSTVSRAHRRASSMMDLPSYLVPTRFH